MPAKKKLREPSSPTGKTRIVREAAAENTGKKARKKSSAAMNTAKAKNGSDTSPKGISKRFLKTRPGCKVTFRLPAEEGGDVAAVAGDFSGWKPLPMKALKKGGFSLTMELDTGNVYQFRYLVDGARWCNDWQADGYVSNQFGQDNSLVEI